MDTNEALTLGKALMSQHGFGHIPMRISGQKRAIASFVHYRPKGQSAFLPWEIRFSRYYLPQLDRDAFVEVMLHEIAHGKAGPKMGHGPVWKAEARKLGIDPKRCHEDETIKPPEASVVGVCPNGHEAKQHRLPLRVSTCHRCQSSFNMDYVFAWYKHGSRVPQSMMPKRYREEMARINMRPIINTW